jgi:transcriptional regulator with XRE-family HTH domain
MAKKSPTVRMRRLGAQLRRIREERGLTLEEASTLVNLSRSALNRMEKAQVGVRPYEVDYLLMKYEVTDEDRRESLLGLSRTSRSKDWVKRYGDLSPGSSVEDLVLLEQDSSAIQIFQPYGIPGILQTEDYARAVKSSIRLDPARDVERAVAFRMARKEVLSRSRADPRHPRVPRPPRPREGPPLIYSAYVAGAPSGVTEVTSVSR